MLVDLIFAVLAALFFLGAIGAFVRVGWLSRAHYHDVRASEAELVRYGLLCPGPVIGRLVIVEQSYWAQVRPLVIAGSVLAALTLVALILSLA
ncbi:MAG: hypothetical protein HY567_00680 [Candidatus Kerfeldbacteria bacterium]|nr:hypothetical protein [Candidatus Kerfeldbacteria bacterium]